MILNERYNRDDFVDFLKNHFLTDFSKDIRLVNTSGLSSITKAYSLGFSKELDLQIFEFEYTGSSKKRIILTKEALTLMRDSANFRALAVFYKAESEEWRFSLMTATPVRNDKGKVGLSYSNPKRYSFLLGAYAKINTPNKFLVNRGRIIDFNDLKSRFSVEVVNKEFYKDISESFNKLVGGTLVVGKKKQVFEPQLKLPSVSDHSQKSLEFAVRLIGRIIFCWFLREKRSPAGNSLMTKELLSLESAKNTLDYYHKILEPIFFEILNKPQKSRIEPFDNELFTQVPYLNGGLFSPQEDDFYKRYKTDSQSQYNNTLIVPDEWICSLFEILETYNFTIDENTSYDEELSIDPEMLGRIFENLLAEINPETGESARKSTGSYYTPRVIVDYMVDESLSLYLKEKIKIDDKKIKALISYNLEDDKDNCLTEIEKEKIIESLGEIKILDPACGSGAFPIGMLQKIVFILQQVDPNAKKMYDLEIKQITPELKRFIQKEYDNGSFDYLRKLRVIRDCIYGIDIQSIATEISRLRCFLTLVVDQKIDDTLDNRGIQPLPNLDFKFVTANSLIGLPKVDQPQQSFLDDHQQIDELKNIRNDYFNATGIEREQIKTEFSNKQNDLVNELIKKHDYTGYAKAELTRKLTSWRPFKHESTDWFDSEWMFGVKDGFDVVISNPPYIQIQKFSGQQIQIDLQSQKYDTFEKSSDLYVLFYERGLKLSKKDTGVLCYITSNKWMKTGYGESLRSFFIKNNPLLLLDLGKSVFESAMVDSNILLIQNCSNKGKTSSITITNNKEDLQNQVVNEATSINFNYIDAWVIGSQAEQNLINKIQKVGTPIKNKIWNASINYGVKTGLNDAFIINNRIKNQLIIEDPKSEEIIKPILGGKDLLRYYYKFNDLFLINTHNGVKNTDIKRVEIDNYPVIKKYLDSKEPKLSKRQDYGDSKYNLRNCAYLMEFQKEKVAWLNLNRKWKFSYVDPGVYVEASLNFISSEKNIKFLVGVLSSNVHLWYFKKTGRMHDNGGFMCKIDTISNFPIPEINEENKGKATQIENITCQIINQKKQDESVDTRELEAKIDNLVYKFYGLTGDEIKIIEESIK